MADFWFTGRKETIRDGSVSGGVLHQRVLLAILCKGYIAQLCVPWLYLSSSMECLTLLREKMIKQQRTLNSCQTVIYRRK